MADDQPRAPEPVWTRPAWVTAIAGVISAFLTVPGVIGDYLAKQQEIEIAKQRVEAERLANQRALQDKEFLVVQNTLAQQGTERVFMLRYFAATLDDADAKAWAEAEVRRLDELAQVKIQLTETRRDLNRKEAELSQARTSDAEMSDLKAEVAQLRELARAKGLEVSSLQQSAGIPTQPLEQTLAPVLFGARVRIADDPSGFDPASWLRLETATRTAKSYDVYRARVTGLYGSVAQRSGALQLVNRVASHLRENGIDVVTERSELSEVMEEPYAVKVDFFE